MGTFKSVEHLLYKADNTLLKQRRKKRKKTSLSFQHSYKCRKYSKLWLDSNEANVLSMKEYNLINHASYCPKECISVFRVRTKQTNRIQYFTFSIESHMMRKIFQRSYDHIPCIQTDTYRYDCIVCLQPSDLTCLYFKIRVRIPYKRFLCKMELLRQLYIEYCSALLNYVPEIKHVGMLVQNRD